MYDHNKTRCHIELIFHLCDKHWNFINENSMKNAALKVIELNFELFYIFYFVFWSCKKNHKNYHCTIICSIQIRVKKVLPFSLSNAWDLIAVFLFENSMSRRRVLRITIFFNLGFACTPTCIYIYLWYFYLLIKPLHLRVLSFVAGEDDLTEIPLFRFLYT